MIEKLKKYFTTISKVCVLEQVTFENNTVFNYVEVSLFRGNLRFKNQVAFLNLEEFNRLNKNKLPVVFTLNGLNVISKIKPSNLESFKNNEFVFTQYSIQSDQCFSIARNESISEVIEFLVSQNYPLVDICVGSFNILKYKELINLTDHFPLPHSFTQHESIEYSFEKEEPSYYPEISIGQEQLQSNFICSLLAGLDYLIHKQHSDEDTPFSFHRKESVYSKLFPVATLAMISVLLVGLIGNYSYQFHLSKKYHDSELEAFILNEKQTKLQILQQEIQEKTRVINQSGLNSNHTFSEYADVLALLIPEGVSFNSLTINPVLKKLKNNKKVQLQVNIVHISGEVNNIETLNNYLMKIERNKLFKNAKIVLFTAANNLFEFELEIEI